MPPLVIYHANCTDGFGAAFAAWDYLGDAAEYFPAVHGTCSEITDLPPVDGRVVYVLDYSFAPDVMLELFARAAHVTWLDHHATSFSSWCGENYLDERSYFTQDEVQTRVGRRSCCIVLNNLRSGAYLAWLHFHFNQEPPRLIAYVDDYDRGELVLPDCVSFNLALVSQRPWEFKGWSSLNQHLGSLDQNSSLFDGMVLEGHALGRMNKVWTNEPIAEAVPCFLPTQEGPVLRGLATTGSNLFANDVGRKLAEISGTYGLCWFMQRDGLIKCCLRSIGDFDVRPLAELHGGGGHRNQAAFRVSMNSLRLFLEPA